MISPCASNVELLLRSCPYIQILATNREKLYVPGDCVWPVSPLSLPAGDDLSIDALSLFDATRLFIERACAVLPIFTPNAGNTASIFQICQRLDGLPLAIELAAARVAILTPSRIAARLNTVFQLLVRATPPIPPRHQTLQVTLDWSYELLSEKERILFRENVSENTDLLVGFHRRCCPSICPQ